MYPSASDPTPTDAPSERRRSRAARILPIPLVAVVALGAGIGLDRGFGGDGGTPAAATSTPLATTSPVSSTTVGKSPATIYREASPGVVTITSRSSSSQSSAVPGGSGESVAQGTGFVIDRDGSILTNDHVVSGATGIRVQFATGRTVDAKVVGTDPSSDLAILDVDVPSSQLHPLTLGSSSGVRPGDPVVAIGDPFGFDRSITAGIVSGLNRSIQAPNDFTISGAIQTDAAINHGNSGGPILDANGKVIGVAAQIADSGVNANVGVGFAIPSDTARRVADDLRASGHVSHSWLGISGSSIDTEVVPRTSGPTEGVVVGGVVAGGPAAKAGLSSGPAEGSGSCAGGDVITRIDGNTVTGMEDLQAAIAQKAPGATVKLTVVRTDGSTKTVSVTLGTQPANASSTTPTCTG